MSRPASASRLKSKIESDRSIYDANATELRRVPILSNIARKLKKLYFLNTVSKDDTVLEIGCGDGWVGRYLRERGVDRVIAIDTTPPAAVVGDIREWRNLGLEAESFDVIVAFEVLEHVDCMDDCFALLKPGGRLLVTSPCPAADWFLEKLEKWKLNQARTSPHDHLTYFKGTTQFQIERMWRPLGMSQWCIFRRESNVHCEGRT
jgi:2-polyprenyl-3-methyl-5-hydroxy-6-metoxy-1,4-benzoquinol methylase